jgi:hypothetical protein
MEGTQRGNSQHSQDHVRSADRFDGGDYPRLGRGKERVCGAERTLKLERDPAPAARRTVQRWLVALRRIVVDVVVD